MKEILLDSEYSAESLCDIERDVYECFDNQQITSDGVPQGVYKVTVVYEE